jgi:hypothetical protein
MGAFTTFFFFFLFIEGAILIGPPSMFLEHWVLPNRSTFLDPQLQIETNVLPYNPSFQFIFMRVELWAKDMG